LAWEGQTFGFPASPYASEIERDHAGLPGSGQV